MASCKKNAARLGAHIVFADESGFLLIPPVRRTWSPRGQTPIHKHRQRHDRVSAISGISISPRRQRLGLYFRLYRHNIAHPQVCQFLRHLLRHLRGCVIVVWDNGRIHKGDAIRAFLRKHPRLRLEAFPAYAPELNPDEGVWNQVDNKLANGRPDDFDELFIAVSRELRKLRRSRSALRWCIHQTEIPPFLR